MKIGDKVVCVDDSPCCQCGAKSVLVLNQLYVIGGIRTAGDGSLILDLIGRPPAGCHASIYGKNGFAAYRFRLLDELKQQAAVKQSASQPMLASEKGK